MQPSSIDGPEVGLRFKKSDALVVVLRRFAQSMEAGISKAKTVAALINAAEDADLANLRDRATHLWPH